MFETEVNSEKKNRTAIAIETKYRFCGFVIAFSCVCNPIVNCYAWGELYARTQADKPDFQFYLKNLFFIYLFSNFPCKTFIFAVSFICEKWKNKAGIDIGCRSSFRILYVLFVCECECMCVVIVL